MSRVREPRTTSSTIRLRAGITPGAFERLCAGNPDLRLERTRSGAIEIMAPAGTGSGGRNAALVIRLGIWAIQDRTGKVFDSSAGFTLPNGAVRAPDAAWIALDRWHALPAEARRAGFASIVPDFVVELRSPSDDPRSLARKMREYAEQGVRLGWLIDPLERGARVYRPGRPTEILDGPTSLSGGDVLPGFVLDLKPIFDEE